MLSLPSSNFNLINLPSRNLIIYNIDNLKIYLLFQDEILEIIYKNFVVYKYITVFHFNL